MSSSSLPHEDFSMVLGGPLYRFYVRARIMRPPLELVARRITAVVLVTWLPLLALSVAGARAWHGAHVPFLADIGVHVRFLASLPLLLLAEVIVHNRMQPSIGEFIKRGIIAPQSQEKFREFITSSARWRNSAVAELAVFVASVVLGVGLLRNNVLLQTTTWYADPGASGIQLTAAGAYYMIVSMTIFRFILFRWYYRLIIWFIFLLRVSRLDLQLIPIHPDKAGGLQFLQSAAFALTPVLAAQSLLVAGLIANRIFYDGAKLTQFRFEILGTVALLMSLALAPLLVFSPAIMASRRMGLRAYGTLASEYAGDFQRKWIGGRRDSQEQLLGSADIQSLADLGNSFQIIQGMNGLPFGKHAVVRLMVAILLPISPLILTLIPLNQLIDRLFKALL